MNDKKVEEITNEVIRGLFAIILVTCVSAILGIGIGRGLGFLIWRGG
jgi:hypothetical protein